MDEGVGGAAAGGGGGGGGSESVGGGRGGTTATCEVGGGRVRFRVELKPGETTIVSWKKLLKDAGFGTGTSTNSSAVAPKPNGHRPGPGLDPNASSSTSTQVNQNSGAPSSHAPSRLAPGVVGENVGKDDPQPPNRLNTVIERIERLYVGKASSDEEDLNDVVPDDDEYDTEDSFIDDTELDEYFQVDNSAIKHDGFFVNRGKLERVEPSMFPNEQPKKRRRKDLGKGLDGSDEGHNPNKHVKAGKKAGKPVAQFGINASGLSTVIALPNVHGEDVKFQNQVSTLETSSRKKSTDTKTAEPARVMDGEAMEVGKDVDHQKIGLPANNHANKMKNGLEYTDSANEKSQEKGSYSQSTSLSNIAELDQSVQHKGNSGIRERPEVIVAESKNSMQNMKVPITQKKEGSSVRPKSTLLEKAIRDLQKMVAESRPPTSEVQDPDNSSQAVKRRLPPEIKHKLAKVARLAQASHGKISKELINRLMSIVGHLVQLRTLKRNLKIMVTMGLSAKQEKDNKVQLVKKEVAEMIKTRIPFLKSKIEQQAGTADDFQEISAEEKEALKRKYSMDDVLEDKICDLYDLYVEGLEEDAGPQVRKLYAELTSLWPSGFMDNHGIKRAICRAKDRKRALYSRNKDPEKINRKKMLARKTEAVRVDSSRLAQPVYVQEKLVADSSDHGTVLVNKSVSSNTMAGAATRVPVSFLNGANVDRPKQEKVKGSASNSSDMRAPDILKPKKLKRKPETELGDTVKFHPEKLPFVQGDMKNKTQKVQAAGPLPKSNPQPTAPSNYE